MGDFLELEIIQNEDNDKDLALKRIEEVLGKTGYSMSDTVTNSYLSMLQGVVDI